MKIKELRRPLTISAIIGLIAATVALGWPIEFNMDKPFREVLSWKGFHPAGELTSISGDLVQVFAIFGGIVAQAIAIVVTVFQPSVQSPKRIKEINDALINVQKQLLGLVIYYALTLVVILAGKVSAGSANTISTFWGGIFLWLSTFMVFVSAGRSIEMGMSVLSLQKLRARLILEEARSRASNAVEREALDKPEIVEDPSPNTYGKTEIKP